MNLIICRAASGSFEIVKSATLEVPNNLWAACRLARPAIGDHVLGALNANNDALVVPLSEAYAIQLRRAKPTPD